MSRSVTNRVNLSGQIKPLRIFQFVIYNYSQDKRGKLQVGITFAETLGTRLSGYLMQTMKLEGFEQNLPDEMSISVIMEKIPSQHKWVNFTYKAIGVIAGEASEDNEVKKIHEDNGHEQFLFSGLKLKLFEDECESYYHNLMSPKPGCFVVADEMDDPDEMPVPYLVSLSFDEVNAYLEGDEHVYAVEIPPELYKWTEAFILSHYVAIKKTKRKLKNWKAQPQENSPVQLKGSSNSRSHY